MIKSITISKVATYPEFPQSLDELREVNFIFGSNGVGKSTIGRIISNPLAYVDCKLEWRGDIPLDVYVYNSDFVEKNFNQDGGLKGVFTLGQQRVDTIAKISEVNNEIDRLAKKIESLNNSLNGDDITTGKVAELENLEAEYKDLFWAKKQFYDADFQMAFEGHRGSAESFKDKVLKEKIENKAALLDAEELRKKASTIFSINPKVENILKLINFSPLSSAESNAIWRKKILGKADLDIARMINRLGNSDWVKQGIKFFGENDGDCPFCQEKVSDGLAEALGEYFDDAFEEETKLLNDVTDEYHHQAELIKKDLDSILKAENKFLDTQTLKEYGHSYQAIVEKNKQIINSKLKEVSHEVVLFSAEELIGKINALINQANILADKHNKSIENLPSEKNDLKEQVWKLVVSELESDISTYLNKKDVLNKSIAGIKDSMSAAHKISTQKKNEIRELEKQITSIRPTIDAVNDLLVNLGFIGFKLDEADDGLSYRLIRSDGADARKSLSEGEKTFITFLYFYHLLKGGGLEGQITNNRVVVFDDPVSSLDSETLFVVSSLIRQLFAQAKSGEGPVKQILILTHNVYFHKEISFNPNHRSKKSAAPNEAFWVIRKPNATSVIEKCDFNPVKTSYELLWHELKRDDLSGLTIQNTLRRILENYFKFYGGVDIKEISLRFPVNEQIIFSSLLSWVNDGSHYVQDDLYVSTEEISIGMYKKVFREIFEAAGHISHYNMMMGIEPMEAS